MALTGLPASSALYIMLAGIWGFPFQEEITETILAVVIFIVAIVGINKTKGANE